MTKRPTKAADVTADDAAAIAAALAEPPKFAELVFWIVGDTPLICHAWSHKAKVDMLEKQVKATKRGKEARDPHQDFVDSLYEIKDGVFGFPATGVKNCILAAAHKDKGIARTAVMGALFLHADMVRTRPALAGAMCDMPLVRIFGSPPEMREDMVRIGAGAKKTANLAYRGQFTFWAMRIKAKINLAVLPVDSVRFLVEESGLLAGIGEWRNEKKGMFGAFHIASAEEELAWIAFATKRGPLPTRSDAAELDEFELALQEAA